MRIKGAAARLGTAAIAVAVALGWSATVGAPSAGAAPAPIPYSQTFLLHSNPASTKVIYLDFVGFQSATETDAPYDLDGVAGFSTAEQDVIQEVWQRVSEAYSAFDVDVTTQDPGPDAFTRSGPDDPTYGVLALIANGGNNALIGFCKAPCVGLAMVGVFSSASSDPSAVILPQQQLGGAANVKTLAATVIHEVGHTTGLGHDSTSVSTSLWSPVMAAVFSGGTPLTQWTSTTNEDAYAVMAENGLLPRADDHGDAAATATALNGPTLQATGIVSTPTDEDWFGFDVAAGAGPLDLSVTPSSHAPMLDIEATLFDGNGQQVALSNPPAAVVSRDVASGLDASFSGLTLPAGRYFLRVRGSGGQGYTNYGSIGTYTVSGAFQAIPCALGSYSATGTQPCTPAPAGSFVDRTGSTSASPCPAGTFSAASGASACTQASPGFFVDAPGATLATPCPPGRFTAAVGASACDPAPPGTYVDTAAAVSPVACRTGSFSAVAGATACTLAPLGHYVGATGAAAAQECSPGSFSATLGASQCTPAPAGHFVSVSGAISAPECSPGSYSAVFGAVQCTQAPVGSYVGSAGATAATPCPPNSTTSAPGATACVSIDSTPPVIVAQVTGGTPGTNGWYTGGPVTVSWQVTDAQSPVTSAPCAGGIVAADTAGTVFTCSATSDGGTATSSVTVRLDATKPTIGYAGNAGTYGILANVALTCSASDALSGLAANSCTNVSGPAWSFGAGPHTVSASATDNAGNTSSASATFTVTVTPADLCTLTVQFVKGSPAYRSLSSLQQAFVNAVASATCSAISQVTPKLSPAAKAKLIVQYDQLVELLRAGTWLTPTQTATLEGLAAKV